MKKYILYLLLASITSTLHSSGCKSCNCDAISKSYLAIRPHFQSASPEMVAGFRDDRLHAREDGWHGTMQFVVFGGKSTNDCDLASYFFPFCKTELLVTEETAAEERALFAQHFNIFTTDGDFRSKISIKPEQSVVGLGIHYRQSFWRDEEKERGFWFSVSFPITRVKNDMNFCEHVIDDGGGPVTGDDESVVANMKEAFQQKEWLFGKVSSCSMKKTKIADIEVKVGYEWLQHEPCYLQTYIGALIPTGNKPTAEFLFEPIVGYGHHAGIMLGGAGGIQLWHDEEKERTVRFEYADHSQYLFRNTQCRSFDLKNKPFSRYLEVYKDKSQAEQADALSASNATKAANLATPGINVFTQPMKVTPGFSHNITTALVGTIRSFQAEAGYNLYCRQAECVELACPWKLGPALKHADGAGKTNPFREITGRAVLEDIDTNVSLANYDDNRITQDDIDLVSAAHPCVLSHTFYGTLGYRWDDREYPLFINGGGSYEFSRNNNAGIDRWLAWAKIGFSF